MLREQINAAVTPLKKEIETLQITVDERLDRAFELVHNCEHRRLEPDFLGTILLQLSLPQSIPKNFISSLVFVSGEKSIVLTYPDNIIFSGDDVVDDVLVPVANRLYNVVFWYDGINVNAVSRGVPYAQN